VGCEGENTNTLCAKTFAESFKASKKHTLNLKKKKKWKKERKKENIKIIYLYVQRAHGSHVHSPHAFSGCKWNRCCLSHHRPHSFLMVHMHKSWPRKIEEEWHEPITYGDTQTWFYANTLKRAISAACFHNFWKLNQHYQYVFMNLKRLWKAK